MKIEQHALHAQQNQSLKADAKPKPKGDLPNADAGPTADPSVVVDISAEATAASGELGGPGKSAQSPAHQARALMAEHQATGGSFGGKSFGELVSRLAQGMDLEEIFLAPPTVPPEDSE